MTKNTIASGFNFPVLTREEKLNRQVILSYKNYFDFTGKHFKRKVCLFKNT